jgi:Hemerythrin HHE cation binding domain
MMSMTAAKTRADRDVIDLLLEQHDEIKSMFGQLRQVQAAAKRELFEDLVRLLAMHETAEEMVVHPVARRKLDNGTQVVEERLAEEEQAKKELAELYDLGVDHPDFDKRLEALAVDVIEHATKEEGDEFLRMRATVDPGMLRRMAGVLKAAEAAAPTRPHPGAPESAAGNLLAGPPLAMFDRIRDAVRDWRNKNDKD